MWAVAVIAEQGAQWGNEVVGIHFCRQGSPEHTDEDHQHCSRLRCALQRPHAPRGSGVLWGFVGSGTADSLKLLVA